MDDADVDDAVSSVDREPSNQHVGTVLSIAIVTKQASDWVVIGCFSLF
jgi:hypothetical protein